MNLLGSKALNNKIMNKLKFSFLMLCWLWLLYSEALIEKFLREADERNELDELLSDRSHDL